MYFKDMHNIVSYGINNNILIFLWSFLRLKKQDIFAGAATWGRVE